MNLEERITQDLKIAMKAKDKAALRALRAIKAAILLQKTDGSGQQLDEQGEIKLVQKLIKQRNDSIDIYQKQNREDLAQTEQEEVEVLKKYLPEQMSEEEIEAVVKSIIQDLDATSMKDMGRVMGVASQRFAGRADGKTIASIVKSCLS